MIVQWLYYVSVDVRIFRMRTMKNRAPTYPLLLLKKWKEIISTQRECAIYFNEESFFLFVHIFICRNKWKIRKKEKKYQLTHKQLNLVVN